MMLNLLVNDPFYTHAVDCAIVQISYGGTPLVAILFQAFINSRFNSCPFLW